MFNKIMRNDKLFIALWIIFIFLLAIAPDKAKALNDSFCNSDKCKARVERLKQCEGATDVVKCATKKTLEALESSINNDMDKLYQLAIKKPSKDVKTSLKQAVEFTSNFEGLRLQAYFDWAANGSDRWSIWYGTKSYKGEIITKQEAIKRKMSIINPIYNSLPACFNENQKTALTSYIYNTGWNQLNLKYYIQNCRFKDVNYIMQVYGWNKELIKRRKSELYMFNKN
mgnify:CR=1 FL=1